MREWRLYLDDMRAACDKVTRYTAGMSLSDLQSDERTYDAVIRNLEVIGEAAKFVPEEVRQRAPDIEWAKIVALRNVIAHVYFGIDDTILWDILRTKVPPLAESLRVLCADL